MNKTVKYLSVLSGAVILAQIFGKFFYFSLFRIFTFEIGYLSLIETGLVFLFVFLSKRILSLFPRKRGEIEKIKSRSQILFLILAFFAGVHLVGGEFQNFFVLRRSFGDHMDMATFYDGVGHLFFFSSVLVSVYWLVKAETSYPPGQELAKSKLGLVLAQSLILSLGFALTIIKSAFIFLCLPAIAALIGYFLLLARRQKTFPFRIYPLFIFFFSILVLTALWLLVWLLLPPSLKRPFIEEYISLPAGYEIETALTKAPIFKLIIRTWD